MTNRLENEIQIYRQCAGELLRLMKLRESKTEQRNAAKLEASTLRAGMGQRLLAGVLADDTGVEDLAVSEAATATVRHESLSALVAALDERISEQQQAVHRAHAAVIRADAERLRAEATEAQGPVDALLQQLKTLTGCDFAPKRTPPPPLPTPGVKQPFTVVTITRTHAEEMCAQAEHYTKAADAIEGGMPLETSFIDGAKLARFPDYLQAVAAFTDTPKE